MITRKQSVKLGVAFCLGVAAITTLALGMTHTRLAFANSMKVRVLRHKDELKRAPDAKERAALHQQNPDKPDKRELKIREFKDVPLKIQEVRNVDSDAWYKDLQVEVKNIGTKPIFGILAYLEFPDHKPGGRDVGMVLGFGDRKYWDIHMFADPGDLHLDPGQTYAFTIPPKDVRVLQRKVEKGPQEFKRLDFHIDVINFGDGTGFQLTTPVDFRKGKQPEGAGYKKHHGKRVSSTSVRSPPQDGCGTCG